ncbi:T9SS type A sorting domain-containing protein [Porphyromonas loveana]
MALFDLNGRCLAISSGGGAVDYVVPSGAYTVRIEVDGQVYVEKVIVK